MAFHADRSDSLGLQSCFACCGPAKLFIPKTGSTGLALFDCWRDPLWVGARVGLSSSERSASALPRKPLGFYVSNWFSVEKISVSGLPCLFENIESPCDV